MKKFLTRVATGIVYMAVIFIALFTTKELFFGIFGIIMMLTINELHKNLAIKNITVNRPLTDLFALCLYCLPVFKAYDLHIGTLLVLLAILWLTLFSVELRNEGDNPFHRIAFSFLSIAYIAVPFTLLAYTCTMEQSVFHSTSTINSNMLLVFLLFLFTWSNDSFAFLWGSLFGKHPMAPKISPKKSFEGLIGGLISTVLLAFAIHYIPILESNRYYLIIILSIIVVAFSTIGDLVESKLKRYVGVKDSGKILPGHGGMLDRFDSLIFSIPAFFAYLQIF